MNEQQWNGSELPLLWKNTGSVLDGFVIVLTHNTKWFVCFAVNPFSNPDDHVLVVPRPIFRGPRVGSLASAHADTDESNGPANVRFTPTATNDTTDHGDTIQENTHRLPETQMSSSSFLDLLSFFPSTPHSLLHKQTMNFWSPNRRSAHSVDKLRIAYAGTF